MRNSEIAELLVTVGAEFDWHEFARIVSVRDPGLFLIAVKEAVGLGSPEDEVVSLMLAGENKVPVIRRYREVMGVGLKEAKDWVEAKADAMGHKWPDY